MLEFRRVTTTTSNSNMATRRSHRLSSRGAICERCLRIDLDSALKWKPRTEHGGEKRVAKLGYMLSMTSPCPFCRFLASMSPDLDKKPAQLALYVLAEYGRPDETLLTVARSNIELKDPFLDEAVKFFALARVSNGQRNQMSHELEGRKIDPAFIDFDYVRGWLHDCYMNHQECRQSERFVHVAGLRFIDCETKKLTEGSSKDAFVALSYVWGTSESSFPNFVTNGHLPKRLPRTIEDAISVTKALGFRYLWVDKYCINQEVDEDRQQQIGQMDLIYQGAEVTIVAAAGLDANHGLPGAGHTRRFHQAHTEFKKRHVVSIMSDPRLAIQDSKWNSRGWTYQEAFLSRRILAFTDDQVYFECLRLSHWETYDSAKGSRDQINRILLSSRLSEGPWRIEWQLQEYCERDLTHDSDIVNAVLGIFRECTLQKYPVREYWGVPIFPAVVPDEQDRPVEIQRSSTEGFLLGLTWAAQKTSRRREGFPSWSWAGWYGGFEGSRRWRSRDGFHEDFKTEISVETSTEQQHLVPFEDYATTCLRSNRIGHASPYLHLDVCTIPLHFEYAPGTADHEFARNMPFDYWATFEDFALEQRVQIGLHLLPKVDENSEMHLALVRQQYLGLVFGDSFKMDGGFFYTGPHTFVMVVQDHGSHFERIGHLVFFGLAARGVLDSSSPSVWKEVMKFCLQNRQRRTIRLG